MPLSVTLISGRDQVQMKEQLNEVVGAAQASKEPVLVEVLVHPWATLHVADAVRNFMRVVRRLAAMESVNTRLIVLTSQDWAFNVIGEVIATKPSIVNKDSVEVFMCEKGAVTRHFYNDRGFLIDWHIGYFTYDTLDL